MRLNPNHPAAIHAEDNWYKLCAALLHKFGQKKVVITSDDLNALQSEQYEGMASISVEFSNEGVILKLHKLSEAQALARKAGGLPV